MHPSPRSLAPGVAPPALLAGAAKAGPYDQLKGSAPPPLSGRVRKAYVDGPWGQVHYHYVEPRTRSSKTPVVFFHPNPFSGGYFDYTLEELGKDRLAIAFD